MDFKVLNYILDEFVKNVSFTNLFLNLQTKFLISLNVLNLIFTIILAKPIYLI